MNAVPPRSVSAIAEDLRAQVHALTLLADDLLANDLGAAEVALARSVRSQADALEQLSVELQLTQEPADAPVGSGCHLLIADDTEVNRVVALTQLERLGHTGVMVNDGQQALDKLLSESFDAVLMDWHMPELDGLGAARAYYAHCADVAIEPIPIIMMTANVSDGARETCAAAGTVDFLPKPVSLDALRACLEQWLPRSPGAEPAASPVPSQYVDRSVIDQMSDDLGGADALVPVIEAFIADSDERRAAVQPGPGHDRAEARRASHTLKSTAALLGAEPLAKLSKELETTFDGDHTPAADLLADFNETLASTVAELTLLVGELATK